MNALRVALADDEPLARTRLARLLREAGCEVVAELPRATTGVLRVQVRGNDGLTFFAIWAGKYGQLPLWTVAFVLICLSLTQRRKN